MLKKLVIHTRRSLKIIVLTLVSILAITGIVNFVFKPTYSVTINGEHVGYTENKRILQKRINEYLEKGEDDNVAFVQVENLPQYELCLLKKNIVSNDEEIFKKIKEQGVAYYRYYAILEGDEEKAYVAKFEDAENIINSLKEKDSSNIDKLSIIEKYETSKETFSSVDETVAKLYVEPVKVIKTVAEKSSGTANTSYSVSNSKVNLGIDLIRPVSGIITSRFGARSTIRSSSHTGLDIATHSGTPIAAVASGTVTFAGWKGSYGNLLIITHENGVQSYYGHCNSLYASVGQTVSQGQIIATVGSTGNSTGPHLHLEIRVNGVAYNPQNYLY